MAVAKNDDLSASLEDYLEAIFNLAGESDVARSKDIARTLGVSKSSVTGALRLLKKKGLAHYEPYDYIPLTDAGKSAAAEVVKKHNILKSFFVDVLGVDVDIAHQTACKAEHTLGPEVIARLLCFIDFINHSNKNGYDLKDSFRRFCDKRLKGSGRRVKK